MDGYDYFLAAGQTFADLEYAKTVSANPIMVRVPDGTETVLQFDENGVVVRLLEGLLAKEMEVAQNHIFD